MSAEEQNITAEAVEEGVAEPSGPIHAQEKTLYDVFCTGNNAAQIVMYCGKYGFRCETLSNAFQEKVRVEALRPMKERFRNIYRGVEVVNGAVVGELERDILSVVFAMNDWSKDWKGKWNDPNQIKVKKASLKLLELTGDRNSITNLPQYAHLLGELRVLLLGCVVGVSGDITSLRELRNLTELNLYQTQVSGDIASLRELRNLTGLYLFKTHVSGDIASLRELRNLRELYLYETRVSGDKQALKSKLPNCDIIL